MRRAAVPSYDVRQTVLDNGVRVVTETVPHSRSVAIGVLVAAGSRDEPSDRAGLAHLCEHLAFQGTSGRSSLDIARLIDSAGGGMGAFTSHEYTCYTATVPEECSPLALDLLGDILLNSTFSDDRLRKEQAAIACEIQSDIDSPLFRSQLAMRAIAWPDHPLGRSVAGTVDSVQHLTREDAIYFVNRLYLPSRVVVVAAGCLHHEDFVAGVRDGFWRLMGQSPPDTAPAPLGGRGLDATVAPVSLAYFSLGMPAPRYADADRYAMHVMTKILGGGISSRLYREVREQRGLAYDIGCEYVAYRDAGLLVINGSTLPGSLTPVLNLVANALADLAFGNGVDEEELVRAHAQIRGQVAMSGEDMHTRMSRLALQALYFSRPIPDSELVECIERVDASAVARAALACAEAEQGQALAVVSPTELDHAVRSQFGTVETCDRAPVVSQPTYR